MNTLKYLFMIFVAFICSLVLFYTTQISSIKTVDLNEIKTHDNNQGVQFYIEMIKNEEKSLVIRGWALNAEQTQPDWNSTLSVILINDSKQIKIPTRIYRRKDIIEQLKTPAFTQNAGFTASLIKKYVDAGSYSIYLLLNNSNRFFLVNTHETVTL